MAKLSAAVFAALVASSSAFVSLKSSVSKTAVAAGPFDEKFGFNDGQKFDPMGFSILGTGEAFDTFPNCFPDEQFLKEAEIKHGRQAMLAWTGVWATSTDAFGLGLHIPGMPEEGDWTKALGAFASEQPAMFATILFFMAIAEGESVGHSGDNFRGKSTKTPGDLNFDYLGIKKKASPEKLARYELVELRNGRAAMIAMASLFAFKSIPGSVPIMDVLGAN